MPQQRDNRYRGRARRRPAPPQRKPGHLRTNYTADDPMYCFIMDMKVVRSVWPDEVIKEDRRAVRRKNLKWLGIVLVVLMVPVTALAVWAVVDGMPWWVIPVAQTLVLLYILIMIWSQGILNKDEDIDIIIYREADRRGIKYVKGKTPLYNIMNRINYDYNSHLWNRNFKWK